VDLCRWRLVCEDRFLKLFSVVMYIIMDMDMDMMCAKKVIYYLTPWLA
jgi:hypothetical protein